MKKPLLFTLLLLLAAFAWADVYPIGTLGTSSSATYGPFSGLYDFGWTKTIVTAAEMTAAGYDGTDNMVGVGYYVGNTPSNYEMLDLHMFIRHTTLTTYNTTADETGTAMPDSTAFTQVFSGNLTFNGGGWFYIAFNLANFDWDGTSNIEIFWKNWDGDYVTGYPTWRYSSTSPDYKLVYKQADTTWPTTAGTRSTSRSNLALVTPQTDPPNPAVLVYPANAGYCFLDGVLSWSDGGGMPDGYDVYLDTVDGSTLVSNDQPGTSYTPTLAPGTTYYWKVVPYNANGPATGVTTWSFKTPTADQIAESFDATEFPPLGWLRTTTSTTYWGRSTTSPFYGAASMYAYTSTSTAYTISTPILAVDATSSLDFYAKASATSQVLQVLQSTDRTTWTQVGADITFAATGIWYPVTIDLSGLTPGNYYLAFHSPQQTAASYIYVDHLFGPDLAAVAPGAPTLTAPADLATDVNEYTTFEWDPPTTGGIPTGYNLYLDTTDGSTLYASDVTSPYTLTTALNYNTAYYWTVAAYNGSGTGPGATVQSFTTRPDPIIYTMPWLEDFGTTGTTFPPTNWTRWSGLLTTEPVTLTTTTSGWLQDDFANIVTDPTNKSAKTNIYGTTWKYWLMTPPIQMPGAGYQLEFDIALTDYTNALPPDDPAGLSGVDDKFVVLISDGTSWSTANAVKVWDNDDLTTGGIYEVYNSVSHTGDHYVIPLDAYTGIKYVAFYGESTVSNADNDFFVDNVRIRLGGQAPEHVTLLAPEDNSTTVDPANCILNWQNAVGGGAPTYYEVFVGTSLIDPGNDYYGEYLYETTNSNLDLSAQADIDLGFNTTWYWAVLPYNDDGNPDPTSGLQVFRFTTLPDPTIVALPHEEYFDSVTAPDMAYGWTGYVNSTSTSAYVRTYSSTTYAQSPPNSVQMSNSADAAADLRLITPMIDLGRSLSQIKLKFYASSSSTGYPLLVGTVDVPDGTGTFNQIASISLTSTKTEYEVSYADYTGTDQYICFMHGLGGTYRSLYIDDVRLLELLPNDLAATAVSNPGIMTAGTAYDFTVDVYNEGTATQSAYTVKLMSVDARTELATLDVTTPLDPGASAQHILSWTPATGGVYEVYGKVVLTGDQNATNDDSPTTELYVLDNTMTVIPVGDDETTTSGYYLPLSMYYKNSVTEELYFTDEMHLQSGTITAIVYKNTFLNDLTGKAVKIWMAHTTVTDLTGGWLPGVDYTLVFDGTVDFPSGVNYIVIPLDTPFSYTGGTLATRVNRPMDTVYHSASDKFYYTTTPDHTNRSRYLYSDSVTYDPLAPSATGTAVGYVPNTLFVVQNATFDPQAILSGHVYQSGTTTPIEGAMVNLTERAVAYTDEFGYYEFTYWDSTFVDLTCSATDYYSSTATGISFEPGTPVTQDFYLQALPSLTVSGVVTSNDYPAGLVGATVELFGYHNYSTTTGAGGVFSIADVKGSVDILAYTWEVSKAGYASASGSFNAIETNVDLGTINLTEYLWTPYNLVASHEGDNARLLWEPAGEPDYLFFDFEDDNGGWVSGGYGDWQWTDAYNVANYVVGGYPDSEVPPTAAYSGTGLWGTILYAPYSMSGAWSYLTNTVDLAGFTSPQMRFWRWNNLYYTFDYYYVEVSTNGSTWTTVLTETAIENAWAEKVVDLSAYADQTIQIRFSVYATTVVSYAGLYIDDIYIGPAPSKAMAAQFGARNDDRWFLNYDVFRFLAADEAIPGNWNLLDGAVADTTYLDTGFAALGEGSYKWAVKANYSGALESEAIISNALGIFITPPDVENGTIGATGNNVTIAWPAEPGASYYTVYGSNDPYAPDPWAILGYSATPSFTFDAGATAYKFFKITASDGEMPASKGVWPQLNK
ncbi:MAG: choice-of-anchor J domain-containing protein [Candidatus Cloacimonetes bacterium]|nr:choice-of-anchor J domain-containing protein [Candidatus Cloacimonadota bacterium]MDY0367378.1 choice-of-anchor J domain-containing protein [Candidatus Syntrophosphaera sp.]